MRCLENGYYKNRSSCRSEVRMIPDLPILLSFTGHAEEEEEEDDDEEEEEMQMG